MLRVRRRNQKFISKSFGTAREETERERERSVCVSLRRMGFVLEPTFAKVPAP